MSHLQIRGISKRFGAFVALSDINLDVQKGEFVVLLGPSGCGKTTLLRTLAGLEMQDEGQIIHAGHDISRLPPAQRDYGIVFQSYALFPNLNVGQNVAYGLNNKREGRDAFRQRVDDMLTLVGLPGTENKYPAQLSGGQQQRIALARALATRPDLLFLDEPLSALDAIERVRLRTEIRKLQQRLGVTPSWSRTTRKKPCRWPTASWSCATAAFNRLVTRRPFTTALPTILWPTSLAGAT